MILRHALFSGAAVLTLTLLAHGPALAQTAAPAPTAAPASAQTAEDAKLEAFLAAAWAEDLARDPTRRTILGLPGDHSQWTPVSDARQAEDAAIARRRLDRLNAEIDANRLSAAGRLNHRLYKERLEDELRQETIRPHFYAFSRLDGAHNSMVTILANNHKIGHVKDAEDYIARLRGMPQILKDMEAAARDRLSKGIAPPAYNFPSIAEASRAIASGRPFAEGTTDSVIWADFQKKIADLDTSEAEKKRLLTAAESALRDMVGPAYRAFASTMEDMGKGITHTDGIWALPRGEELYRSFIKLRTTTERSPEDIHQTGLTEVARIQDEMRGIMKQVEFKGSLQDFFDYLETEPKFYLPDTPEGHAAYIAQAKQVIARMEASLGDYFGIKPKAPLEVRRVEPFREKSAPGAHYLAPSLDGSRPGIYYANMSNMHTLPLWDLETLAYHEAIPGHHMQIAIAQERTDLPEFRRTGGYTAFSEGWALYSEKLGKEMGFFQDPYADAGRLAAELFRAVRLVVDTGLHHKKWTREQAIQYMNDNLPNDEMDNTREVDRYLNWPGQALAYKIGMMEILRLREEARKELGSKFDIKGFHDVVLGSAGVPLPVLEELVRTWVAEKAKA